MVGERSPQGLEGQIAFLGVTNEKQHVGLTTQAFHTKELEFWRCWHKFGCDATLAYAAADRAAVPSLVPPADQDSGRARGRRVPAQVVGRRGAQEGDQRRVAERRATSGKCERGREQSECTDS